MAQVHSVVTKYWQHELKPLFIICNQCVSDMFEVGNNRRHCLESVVLYRLNVRIKNDFITKVEANLDIYTMSH